MIVQEHSSVHLIKHIEQQSVLIDGSYKVIRPYYLGVSNNEPN